MKKLIIIAVLVLLPSTSFAAPLTTAQADSLINVVKASPSTPASAFTGLITAFSNITVAQAVSLIGVVQASPSAPATSFESLLIAFTQDATAQSSTPAAPSSNAVVVQNNTLVQNNIAGPPAPTCTLVDWDTTGNGNNGRSIQWSSTNATSDALYYSSGGGSYKQFVPANNGLPDQNYLEPVSGGSQAGFSYVDFKAFFYGPGGSVSCDATYE
jgi:hypothetical protein